MPNLFLGFPVARARIADMIATQAPPLAHAAQHESGGSDEISGLGGASLPFDDFYYVTRFDSIDGFDKPVVGTAVISLFYEYVQLRTFIALNDRATLLKAADYPFAVLSWNKARTFRTTCYVNSGIDSLLDAWIGTGDIEGGRGLGFYFTGGKIYARAKGPVGTTDVEIVDLGSSGFSVTYEFKVVFTPAVNAKFYLDGVLKATITTNLPSGSLYSNEIASLELLDPGSLSFGYIRSSFIDVYQEA